MTTNKTDATTTPQLGTYEIDTDNSSVTFKVRHLFGLASVRGTFTIRAGTVNVAEPVSDSGVLVEIDTASFHTGTEQRDGNVRSARFLDVDRYPVMTFTSGRLDGSTLEGTLTVRGITRPVSLIIDELAVQPGEFTARATSRIDRTEFGVTAQRGIVGRYLGVVLEIRCVRV